jgi:hypothetical protein
MSPQRLCTPALSRMSSHCAFRYLVAMLQWRGDGKGDQVLDIDSRFPRDESGGCIRSHVELALQISKVVDRVHAELVSCSKRSLAVAVHGMMPRCGGDVSTMMVVDMQGELSSLAPLLALATSRYMQPCVSSRPLNHTLGVPRPSCERWGRSLTDTVTSSPSLSLAKSSSLVRTIPAAERQKRHSSMAIGIIQIPGDVKGNEPTSVASASGIHSSLFRVRLTEILAASWIPWIPDSGSKQKTGSTFAHPVEGMNATRSLLSMKLRECSQRRRVSPPRFPKANANVWGCKPDPAGAYMPSLPNGCGWPFELLVLICERSRCTGHSLIP